MKKKLIVFYFKIQVFFFTIFNFLFRIIYKQKNTTVIGVEEIASFLSNIKKVIPFSVNVNFNFNKFYNYSYDYDLSAIKPRVFKGIYSAILLAYLSSKHKNFIYISGAGFFISDVDGRETEFRLLKSKGCNVLCFYTGSDIRSFLLMDKFSHENEIDVITTYQRISHKNIDSKENEAKRKMLAIASEKYADAIFNPNIDQMSYFKRPTHSILYFVEKKQIREYPDKFSNNEIVKIVHAPSSPIIKGTPLVRAAIKKLKEEGYIFNYVELIDKPNKVVLEELSTAHIVLNQFYAFVPSVFGIEAMANNAVLLTSADKNIEPSLQGEANEAWVVTPYWLVYDKLKEQLDKTMLELKEQADKGTEWVKKYCTEEYSAKYLNNVINEITNCATQLD